MSTALASFHVPAGALVEPIAQGLALPRGALAGPARVLGSDGQPRVADARVLLRWPDGSVRWLLVELLAPPKGDDFTVEAMPAGEVGASGAIVPAPAHGLPSGVSLTLTDAGATPHVPRAAEGSTDLGCFRSSRTQHGRLGPLRLEIRHSVFAGTDLVRLEVVLHNPQAARHRGGLWDLGDPGSVLFEDVSLRIEAKGPTTLRTDGDAPLRPLEPGACLFQASSGGDQWNGPNHLDASGRNRLKFRGFRCGARQGLRAQPELRKGPLRVAVPEFWQTFPKVLEHADDDRSVRIGLFPREHGQPFELQGGERKRHTVWLSHGSPVDFVARPRRSHQPPAEIAASGALHGFGLPDHDPPGATARLARIVDPVTGLAARREVIDEYGWRNWGDLYADHEAVHHTGSQPLVSHYNNQYDCVEGFLLCWLRSGDRRFFELADPLARHVADVDLYHTEEDRSAYNHGQFWHTDHYRTAGTATHRCHSKVNARGQRSYGGGPGNEQNYPSGLWLHHLLTGDPWTRAAGRQLADWTRAMDDGATNVFGLVDDGPTGLASQTVLVDYHGPGRGPGNSINALCEAFLHDGDRGCLEAAEALIRRCVHPEQDLDALDLLHAELRWSYVVFLKYLLKYLDLKADLGELDAQYVHARRALIHYARYMVARERPSTTDQRRLDHVTETWPAQDLRKAQVVHGAATYVEGEERAQFHAWADATWTTALAELEAFPTANLCRPLVLTIHPAIAVSHARAHRDEAAPPLPTPLPPSLPPPEPFLPQKARIRAALHTPGGWAHLAQALIRPEGWRRVRRPW